MTAEAIDDIEASVRRAGATEMTAYQVDEKVNEQITKTLVDRSCQRRYDEQLSGDAKLELIEDFARFEHDRWSSERYIQGWCSHEKRDDDRLRHPALIEYDQLTGGEKMKDREALVNGLEQRVISPEKYKKRH